LRRDVSGVRQPWDEEQIRSLAKRFGYDLEKTVTFSNRTDRPEHRLCTVVARIGAAAVFVPSVEHFRPGEVPRALRDLADIVSVNDEHIHAKAVAR
jgi:hypothetical protein